METIILKKSASFRLSPDLLDALKHRAKESNCSLNNYVENVLFNAVHMEPNTKTKAALKEAQSGKTLDTLDLENFDDYIKSL